MNDPVKISFPKIPPVYWKSLLISSLGAVGFALCADLNGTQMLGTLLLANAACLGIVAISGYLDS